MAKTDNLIRATDFAVFLKGMRGDWVVHPDTGRIYSNSIGDFLKPSVKAGYQSLVVNLKDGERYYQGRVSLHRAIWVLCRGIPLSLNAEVDHLDGDRENNRLENLRLVPAEENTVRNLTFEEAEEIRKRSREGVSWKVLAEEFKISYSTIRRILAGKTHKDPTKKLVCGRL
jgi:predicted DNA-binding protein (UPF0251 family)